jgi:hypothetical protein
MTMSGQQFHSNDFFDRASICIKMLRLREVGNLRKARAGKQARGSPFLVNN